MPFAGHPTLGTAHVVARRGATEVTLELAAGLVPVTRRADAWTLRAAKPPTSRVAEASPRRARARARLARGRASPASRCWVDTGVEQLVMPLRRAEDVLAARPVAELIERHAFSATAGEAMATSVAGDQARAVLLHRARRRGRRPGDRLGVRELGGYLLETGAALPVERVLNQGAAVGRPSRLHLRVGADRAIYVTGTVVDLARGELEL